MLKNFAGADRVYLASGYTDLRRGIDGLASIVQEQFRLDPFTNALFLFCGRRRDRIKALYWEGNGFVMNEAEVIDAQSFVEESPGSKVKAHTRKRRSGSIEDVIPGGLPVEVVEHRLGEEDRHCPDCDTQMVEIGKESHRSLKITPPQYSVVEDVYYTYACKCCEQETGETVIVKTPKTPMVFPGSFASPEAIAHIMVQKFVMYSPLYRQEQEMNRAGLQLSRQTMSNWLLHASEDWLRPIYDRLHEQLSQCRVLHGDETTLQVLKEPGKSAQSKSYMWLYRTSGDAHRAI